MLAGADADDIAAAELHVGLAVDAGDGLLAAGDLDLDGGPFGQDDAVGGGEMRRDGRHEDLARLRVHDGAADAERVGRGAGRGGDDDAVGAVHADGGVVGADGELHRAADGGATDDDIVQGVEVLRPCVSPSRTVSVCIIARVSMRPVAADDGLELLEQLRRGDLGEEADAAEVDAEQDDRDAG